jgi:DNA (cytosine-5)-methyltransferase 1
MKRPYKVVDLFAGPGGLAEGFSSVLVKGKRSFDVAFSVEMEQSAHRTLTLRSFTRQFPPLLLPDEYYRFLAGGVSLEELKEIYPKEWKKACKEALRAQLGTPETAKLINPKIDKIRKQAKGRTVLIGGPPCQAYSLVGRARNAGNSEYNAEDDGRHFLYREYIEVLDRLRPAAFVMENVKGILSSEVSGAGVFDLILKDLENVGKDEGGYKLVALVPNRSGKSTSDLSLSPHDFIVRSEQHVVPQARHRVFVVGIRADVADKLDEADLATLLPFAPQTSVHDVLSGMPALRSGLSKGDDNAELWKQAVVEAAELLLSVATNSGTPAEKRKMKYILRSVVKHQESTNVVPSRVGSEYNFRQLVRKMPEPLIDFLLDKNLPILAQHETRSHMKSDLARYLFCSVFAKVHQKPPKASDFPVELAPNHRSWSTGKFADRFRVQSWNSPSKTVTSHIAKDGHYYIHPDPNQCRSLTVREAARLQTFPDNYLFLGTRTEQYVQVGNAVPPYLAKQIAEALTRILP